MTTVLLVDDIRTLAEQYAYDLKRLAGYDAIVAVSGEEALDALSRESVDCVILDLEMPGIDGFDVLRRLKALEIKVPVIVYTGTGNYDRCVQAVQLGAAGFIDKAEPMERVVHGIEVAVDHAHLTSEVERLHKHLDQDTLLVGASPAMTRLRESIGKIAGVPSPVLIMGESGTGKELVAHEIHRLGSRGETVESGRRRADPPFLAVNCAALPEQLIESELFGHERGAFTGANRLRKGAFEDAGSGTLFLDEIGELPLTMQAKLLRVLEQREIVRVGSNRPVPLRARVVAATNRDLDVDVETGRFRQDLLYRLNVHTIHVPPLRERPSDIPVTIKHFNKVVSARFGIREKTWAPEALEALMEHDWSRNNVRELRNVIERMIIAAEGDQVDIGHVPPDIDVTGNTNRTGPRTFAALKAEAERSILVAALERNDWHISNTARDLGLADHASLLKIMRRHGLRSTQGRVGR